MHLMSALQVILLALFFRIKSQVRLRHVQMNKIVHTTLCLWWGISLVGTLIIGILSKLASVVETIHIRIVLGNVTLVTAIFALEDVIKAVSYACKNMGQPYNRGAFFSWKAIADNRLAPHYSQCSVNFWVLSACWDFIWFVLSFGFTWILIHPASCRRIIDMLGY